MNMEEYGKLAADVLLLFQLIFKMRPRLDAPFTHQFKSGHSRLPCAWPSVAG